MINACTKIKINEEYYEILVNVGSMIECEKASGSTFLELIKGAEKGSIPAIAVLLSECLVKDGQRVGYDFVCQMEFEVFDELISPLIDTIVKAFPSSNSDKKKVIVIKR